MSYVVVNNGDGTYSVVRIIAGSTTTYDVMAVCPDEGTAEAVQTALEATLTA